MNLKNEFNRLGDLINCGVEKTRAVKRGNGLARRVRDQVNPRGLASAEERMVRHMRENPSLYLLGAALLLGMLIAKLIIESGHARRHAPLM